MKKTVQEEGNELAAALEQQMLPSGSQAEEINDLPQAPSESPFVELAFHSSCDLTSHRAKALGGPISGRRTSLRSEFFERLGLWGPLSFPAVRHTYPFL